MKLRIATPRVRALWLLLIPAALLLAGCAGATNPSSSWPGLITDEERGYLAFNQAVYAVDLDDGQEVWRFSPEFEGDGGFYSTPALTEDRVFVGGYNGTVYAIDRESGQLVWEQNLSTGRIIGGVAVSDDLLFVPSSDRTLYALDVENGQTVWTFEAKGSIWARPLVAGERIYVAALDHFVYALNASDGSLIWSQELGGALADQPAQLDGVLLTGTFGQALNALDADSGEVVWTVPTEDWVWGNPAVGEELAFFGDVSGALYAVNSAGGIAWQNSLNGGVAASPAYGDGRVYFVTEEGSVFAREAENNDPVWQQQFEARLLADPVLVNDTLLVAALDGENLLTALDAESGAIRWSFQPAEE